MRKKYLTVGVVTVTVLLTLSLIVQAQAIKPESPLLNGAYRVDENGWIYVHLEGTPFQVGYQNGYLLYDNFDTACSATIHLSYSDETFGDLWYIRRDICRLFIWPKLTAELKTEIEGIAAGLRARGLKWDKWDVLAFNAWPDVPVYKEIWESERGHPYGGHVPLPKVDKLDPGCSAFVATGSSTKDGLVVIGHNTWAGYAKWGYCSVIIDLTPMKGHRIVYQSFGGSVWSGPDWIYNDEGLMLTETTISGMETYDPTGIPVFVRERYAMQYSSSIDDFIEIMTYKNNGAYANNWLIGDAKTGEICSLELGCYEWDITRTFDGFITSCNYPTGPNVRTETTFDWTDTTTSEYCRTQRWLQFEAIYEGSGLIDCELGMSFISDHYDTYLGIDQATHRTLCGHGETETGPPWAWGDPWPNGGATDGKVTDGNLVLTEMGMWGRIGHPCGTPFIVSDFLTTYPEYSWQLPYLHDLPTQPWTYFYDGMTP